MQPPGEPVLQRFGRLVSEALGREATLVRLLRRTYEILLEAWSGGRGYVRVLNGTERFFIDPRRRNLFPDSYEPEATSYLRSHVKPGQISLNVGAYVGVYALCLAEWSKPDGHVFAFEPNPAARRLLEDHVRRNGYQANVTVQVEAVGSSIGTGTIYAAGVSGTTRLDQPNPGSTEQSYERIPVDVTTVDAFCQASGLQPDWIVMDIEGYEVGALMGATRTIRQGRHRLGLVVEMHPALWALSGTSRSQLETLLASLKLRAVALNGENDPLGVNGMVLLEYV